MTSSKCAVSLLRKCLDAKIKSGGFDTLFSEVKILSGGNGKCVAQLQIQKEHQNIKGTLHGGVTASLVDTISTITLMASERQLTGSSVDLKVSYLRPVPKNAVIIIEADTVKIGKTLAFLTVKIKDEKSGKIVATGEHIKYVGDG
ncbi:UNVERIFIED_CONTAM: hypothetical protein RMT77_006609 [Armadillidium vulgare]|nr:Acyl-coenzyme A thioesterase 13 [Armadillidium vulgare]